MVRICWNLLRIKPRNTTKHPITYVSFFISIHIRYRVPYRYHTKKGWEGYLSTHFMGTLNKFQIVIILTLLFTLLCVMIWKWKERHISISRNTNSSIHFFTVFVITCSSYHLLSDERVVKKYVCYSTLYIVSWIIIPLEHK